jgi:hypothetical protein
MHIVDIKHTYSTKEIVQVSKYMHSSGDSAREMKGYECGLKKGCEGDEGVYFDYIFSEYKKLLYSLRERDVSYGKM